MMVAVVVVEALLVFLEAAVVGAPDTKYLLCTYKNKKLILAKIF